MLYEWDDNHYQRFKREIEIMASQVAALGEISGLSFKHRNMDILPYAQGISLFGVLPL